MKNLCTGVCCKKTTFWLASQISRFLFNESAVLKLSGPAGGPPGEAPEEALSNKQHEQDGLCSTEKFCESCVLQIIEQFRELKSGTNHACCWELSILEHWIEKWPKPYILRDSQQLDACKAFANYIYIYIYVTDFWAPRSTLFTYSKRSDVNHAFCRALST